MSKGIFDVPMHDIVAEMPVYDYSFSLGQDIEEANSALANIDASDDAKIIFQQWAARFQPCLFGRIGSRNANGVSYDFEVITESDINKGDFYLIKKIQGIRREWKQKTLLGNSSALLILFNHRALARAKPGVHMLRLCQKVSDLYFVEHAPIDKDVIYTEAVPLQIGEDISLFKGGVNIFYPGSHRTLNHDRRVPGGLVISINSPGHLANALVYKGYHKTLDSAVRFVYETAMHSVGNGGHRWSGGSATWHNSVKDGEVRSLSNTLTKCPAHIPTDYNGKSYSALYHTDVLVPSDATLSQAKENVEPEAEVWKWLSLDYIANEEATGENLDEWFAPGKIKIEAIFHNPWPPIRAVNSADFVY